MATDPRLINYYNSIPDGCRKCNGTCFDDNPSIRQKSFREKFPELPLPDKCAATSGNPVLCPAQLGAL